MARGHPGGLGAAGGDQPDEDQQVDVLDTAEAGPSVIRGGLLRLAGHVLGALATVAGSAVVIRHLGVVDTGRFVTVMALAAIVGAVGDLGLSAYGVREYSVKPGEASQRLLRNLLGLRVAFAACAIAITVAFAAAADYTRTMVTGTVLAGLGVALFAVHQSLAIPLHVRLRFGWVAALQLLFQLGVVGVAALLALAGASLLPFFALQLPIILPIIAATVVIGGREARVWPAFEAREWRRMMSRILPFSVAVVLSVLYFRFAQIMVSLLSTELQSGYFGLSFRILEALTTIPGLVVSSALPVLARAAAGDSERFAYAAGRLAETVLIAGVGLALAIFLGAEFAVQLVAGSGFGPSVAVLRVLALALIGTFLIAARGYALVALDRMRAVMISNAVALAVVATLGIPLIEAHGAIGAAVALVAAEIALAAGYELALARRQRELRLSLAFCARVALAAAMAAAVLALGLPSVAATAIGVAIYGAALLAVGAVPGELRQAVLPRRAG